MDKADRALDIAKSLRSIQANEEDYHELVSSGFVVSTVKEFRSRITIAPSLAMFRLNYIVSK